VGVSAALLALTFVDRPVRQEFLLLFLSGFWALVPDGHWMLREFGLTGPANVWRSVHQTVYANVFWFDHLIDHSETGRNNIEAGVGLAVMLACVAGYYVFNDWSIGND